jgi:thioredoxin 1
MYYSTKINNENLDSFLSTAQLAMLYIKASWCGPCKILSPVVEEIANEVNNNLVVGKIDADDDMEFVKSLNVRNVPTILFYKEGELVERSVGAKSKGDIQKIIENLTA